jgi:hypothetical protein
MLQVIQKGTRMQAIIRLPVHGPSCQPATPPIPSNANEEFIGSFSLEMSEQEKGKRIPQNKKEKGKGMRQ